MDLFARKPRVIPNFSIPIKESLEELDFNPDIIAKFEFPETPPWTYPTAMINLTLSYAKKDQTDPSKYIVSWLSNIFYLSVSILLSPEIDIWM